MPTTIRTEHSNELIVVEDILAPQGNAVVALGLINEDASDTFPGRTLAPEQAEELAASLAMAAALARARAGLAATPVPGARAHADTLDAVRAAVPLADSNSAPSHAREEPRVSGEGDRLPIDGYDGLSAAAITKQLSGLSETQLSTVLAYEQSHRKRKTICERIAAVQSSAARRRQP